MTLDPQAKAYLDMLAASGAPPYSLMTPEDARRASEASAATLAGPVPDLPSVEERTIPGGRDGIRVRVYRPVLAGRLPVTVYFHGGGWVIGSLDTHDVLCRRLALAAGCAVASVDYRMAPEHRFPSAVEDAWAAVSWVARRAAEIGGDPERIAVAGDSAGGNLAAVAALRARDAGIRLALQALIYPVTDCDLDTPSYQENGTGYGLTRDSMRWFWDHYLPHQAARVHPDASPLRAPDLSRVAPALVAVCEYDPLRDEGEAYARRLERAGVPVRLVWYPGMIHGFARMFAVIDRAHQLVADVASSLRGAFAA